VKIEHERVEVEGVENARRLIDVLEHQAIMTRRFESDRDQLPQERLIRLDDPERHAHPYRIG
jgi:hypothetical protein